MKRCVPGALIGLVGAASLALVAPAAWAQQTQTFAYDVHGRLTGVTRTTGASSQTTTYGLDNADNRTSRVVSAPGGGGMAALPAGAPAQETSPLDNAHAPTEAADARIPLQPEARTVPPPAPAPAS